MDLVRLPNSDDADSFFQAAIDQAKKALAAKAAVSTLFLFLVLYKFRAVRVESVW